jgi:hypothetical protein
MISDDELRARLSRIDPLPTSVPVDPYTSPRAQDLLERVMTTQIHDKSQKSTVQRWRKPALLTAAAAAVIALGIVAVGVTSGGPTIHTKVKTTLALKLPGGGTSGQPGGIVSSDAASCVGFSIPYLREMPMAFAGTVTAVSDSNSPTLSDMTVTLTVDHWYKGGTADLVTLTMMTSHALTPTTRIWVEDGVELVQGKRYLVTATNGTVNSCGFTGEATPELEKAFAAAFPG